MRTAVTKKSLGVLMHPTCIPGGICGTFGKGAKEWIKTLHKYGIEYWQFLPLTPTDSTGSPYSSPSSFALNPWFLDIDTLIEKGFISISDKDELGLINQNENYFESLILINEYFLFFKKLLIGFKIIKCFFLFLKILVYKS